MIRIPVQALLLVFAILVTSPAARSAPVFMGLGDLSGGSFSSIPFGIAPDGSAVVGVSTSADGRPEAFRWTPALGMVGLGFFPGAEFPVSVAYGASAAGAVVVGESRVASGAVEAFRWTSSEGLVGLGLLPGDLDSVAAATSANGSIIVGTSSGPVFAGAGSEAFAWTEAGGMVGLGALPGGDYQFSGALDVSSDGSIVVGSSQRVYLLPGGGYSEEWEAFRWTAAGGMEGLGDLPGGDFLSFASGVSDDGSVVVGTSGMYPGLEAFRWTEAAGMQGLGFLPGHTTSRALGVSGDGSVVVGGSLNYAGDEIPHAFIWDPAHGMRELADVLGALGVDLAGWRLDQAYAISADGLVIVGNGTNPRGDQEAWIAMLPEPSSGLLVALGVVALGCRRRSVSDGVRSARPRRPARSDAGVLFSTGEGGR